MNSNFFDPFTQPSKRAQKNAFKQEEETRENLYRSTGVDFDKDVDGRVYPTKTENNRRLGLDAPGMFEDGRVDLDGRRALDSRIQGIPQTSKMIDDAKKRRSEISSISKGYRAELDNFDRSHGVKVSQADEWDDVAGEFKKVERVDFDGIVDDTRRDALLQSRKYIQEELNRSDTALNDIDVEIGRHNLARQKYIQNQRSKLGAKPGDIADLDDSPEMEVGSPEWYDEIDAHGGIVRGGKKRAADLPSPYQGEIVGPNDPIRPGVEGHHRVVEGMADNVTAKVTDIPNQAPVEMANESGPLPEATDSQSNLSELSGSYRRFMETRDDQNRTPSAFDQAVWMSDRIEQLQSLREKASDKGAESFDLEEAALLKEQEAIISEMTPYQLARLDDKTRDPRTKEIIKNFGARFVDSVGTGLTDMAEFANRQYIRFHPLGYLGAKLRNETATDNTVSRFLGAMREVADEWGPDVPEEVSEKLLSGKGTLFAEGLGSAVSFMLPGMAVSKMGKLSKLSPKAMKLLTYGSTAVAGAAVSGNALRREVVQNNEPILNYMTEMLQSGEITQEAYDKVTENMQNQAAYAEALGAAFGLTEAIPLGNMLNRANRLGGTALTETLLKRLLSGTMGETLEAAGQKTLGKGVKALASGMEEATEEALQEYYQTLAENAAASGWGIFSDEMAWDKQRGLLDGAVEGLSTGGAVGFTLSMLVSAMPGRQRREFGETLRSELAFQLAQQEAMKTAGEDWRQMNAEDRAAAIDQQLSEMSPDDLASMNEQVDKLLDTPSHPSSGIRPFNVVHESDQYEDGSREMTIWAKSMDDALDQLNEMGVNDNVTVDSAEAGGDIEIVNTTVFTGKDGDEITLEGNPVEARKKLPNGFEVKSVRPGEPIEKEVTTNEANTDNQEGEVPSETGGQPSEVSSSIDNDSQRDPETVPDAGTSEEETELDTPKTRKLKEIKETFKLSDRGTKALDQIADAVERVVGEDAFDRVKIDILSANEMPAGFEETAGAWDRRNSRLILNRDVEDNKGDEAITTIFHESGHVIAEAMDDFVYEQWSGLTPEQREAAKLEYNPDDTRTDSELLASKNARQEWFNFQLFRVAKEGPKEYKKSSDLSDTLKDKVIQVWNEIREIITKWIGDPSLSTQQLDSRIREILFGETEQDTDTADLPGEETNLSQRDARSSGSDVGVASVDGQPSIPTKIEPTGNSFKAKTPENNSRTVSGRWAIVDAAEIKTSQDEGYDQSLQPRNRNRRASQDQVAEIAQGLDPERIADSTTTDLGAPIVTTDGMVISGNGRTSAVRQAYQNRDRKAGQAYREWLKTDAQKFGIDSSVADSMDQPMLVRVIEDFGGMTPKEFARVSNQDQTMGMSIAEKASVDAQIILESPALRELFRPNESAGVMASTNREFLNQFIESTGDRVNLISSDGSGYPPELEPRLKRALIAAAVGPNDTQLITALTEETEGIRRVANAVAEVAPQLVEFQGTEFDVSNELADALRNYVSIVREGSTVDQFLSQVSLFGDEVRTAESDEILRVFGKHGKRSARKIIEFFQSYIDQASNVDTTTQGLNLGIDETTKSDILSNSEQSEESQPEQTDLPQGESESSAQNAEGQSVAPSRQERGRLNRKPKSAEKEAAIDQLSDAFDGLEDLAGTPSLNSNELNEFEKLASKNDSGEKLTESENNRFLELEDRLVESQKGGKLGSNQYSLAEAVEDIRAGRTTSPLKAINEAVRDAIKHREDVKRRAEARKSDRQRGKLSILDNITRAAKQGKVPKDTAQALTSFVNSLEDRFIDDVAISLRARGQAQGTFDFAESLVTIFRNSNDMTHTGIHEFWHALSRLIPASEVTKIANDYANSLVEYLKQDPEFYAFVGRETLSTRQYEELLKFSSKESLEDRLSPLRNTSGNIEAYRIRFNAENYRYHSLDEWIAEKLTDEVLNRGDGLKPNTIFSKVVVAIRRFLRIVKRHLGQNPYHNVVDAVFNRPDTLGFARFGPVAQATPLYEPNMSRRSTVRNQSTSDEGELALAPTGVFSKTFPKSQRKAFLAAAESMADAGINTPEELAEILSDRFGGKFNGYAQSLWNMIASFDDVAASNLTPDWKATFAGLDNSSDSADIDSNVSNREQPLERDSDSGDVEDASDASRVSARRGSDQSTDDTNSEAPGTEGREPESGRVVSGSGSTADGEQSDSVVSTEDSEDGTRSRSSGRSGSSSRRGTDGSRSDAKQSGEGRTDAVARSNNEAGQVRTEVVVDPDVDQRLASQKQADQKSHKVKWGDLQSVKDVAPLLLHDQHIDVANAENRFFGNAKPSEFNPNGKGMLFTNGTGTGKTFVGLGTAKRFVSAGKTEILFIVPTGKVTDWIEDAKLIGLEASTVPDTKSSGKGVTVVGFENFRQNPHLWARKYDLVISDEAHKLMSNKDGEVNATLQAFRIVAGHKNNHRESGAYRNPEWFELKLEHEAKLKPLEKKLKLATSNKDQARQQKIRTQINQLQWQFNERTSAMNAQNEEDGKGIYSETKTLFLSATPFAYHKALEWANGYIIDWDFNHQGTDQVMIGDSRQSPMADFFVRHLGYRIRYHKLTEPDAQVDGSLMERELSKKLTDAGAMSGRMINLDHDYSRDFVLVDSKLGAELDRGVGILQGYIDRDENEFHVLPMMVKQKFNYVKAAQMLESIKAVEAVNRAKKHVALGRKVVVFHSYLGSTPTHPFEFNMGDIMAIPDPELRGAAEAEINKFNERYPELVNLDFSEVANILDMFRNEFGESVTFFNGQSKSTRQTGMELFNQSGSGVDIIVAQVDAAQEGLSLHDTDGKHQRVLINVGIPVKPVTVAQEEGRIYRVGLKSDAAYENLVLHTNMERSMFGEKASQRSGTVENLAMGDLSRNLKEVLREGYMNARFFEPNLEQGKGGVASDRRIQTTSDFDRAKTYYYGRLKRNSKTKALEGKDYFATPEPIGYKMVEWAGARPGESMLEPSAGHGAIGRFFPDTTSNTFVEPSPSLSTEAKVNTSGRFEVMNFEDLAINNKYDAVVMNPPFGVGGKTAYDHIRKAVQHLRDGGRIVALVPDGPAADKQFEKFMTEDAQANVYVPTIFQLPFSTFERAGTKIATRILIIDKINDLKFAQSSGYSQGRSRIVNLRDIEDINDLFNEFEGIGVDPRVTLPVKEKLKSKKAAQALAATEDIFSADQFNHTKTGDPIFVAKMNVRLPDWQEVKAIFKKYDGYYSKFKGAGAIPRIHFKTAEARDSFIEEAQGALGGSDAELLAGTPLPVIEQVEEGWASAPRNKGNAEQERVIGETIGDLKDNRTVIGRTRDFMSELRSDDFLRVRQGVFDSFASIREYEKRIFGKDSKIDAASSAYKMSLMTKNLPSVMMQVINEGTLEYVNGSIQLKKDSRSLASILNMVGDKNLKLWEGYVAAVRADRLLKEGKENNFADDPEDMEGGMTARQKVDSLLSLKKVYPEFEKAREAYAEWNRDLLDFAEAAGIIDPSARKVWEKNDYVPFYRMADAAQDGIKGPIKKKGISGQDAGIQTLKGGEGRVAIIENIFKNAEKLVDASFKNIAMQRITQLAEDSEGILEAIPHKAVPFKVQVKEVKSMLENEGVDTSGMTDEDLAKMVNFWRMRAPKGPDVVSVSENGKPKYFKVNDPLLLQSILDLGPEQQSWVLQMFGAPKRLLTAAVTLDPVFMMANWLRDSINAYFVSDSPLRWGIDSVMGVAETMAESDSYKQILASGGSSGAYQRIKDKDIRRQLARMTQAERRRFKSSIMDSPHKIVRGLKRVGRASEMANRVAVYNAAIRQGASPQEASFQAMDLTNFTMHGQSQFIRTFTATVPFLNARLQGLYKLGRSSGLGQGETKLEKFIPTKRFAAHAGIMVMASLALLQQNWDDDRYWDLEDWDRDLYYHVWFGDEHFRFPKPFEVGAIFSTLPERMAEAMFKRNDTDLLGKSVGSMFLNTFAFNPIPQAVMPVVEQFGNYQFFGGRPIVGKGDSFKSPEQQYSPWTSDTFREMAKAMPDNAPEWLRSPKRLEHVWRGYTGTVGMYVMDVSDMLVRKATGAPPSPDFGVDSLPILGNFKRRFNPDDSQRSNRYVGDFYELYNKLLTVEQGIRDAKAENDKEAVDALQGENSEILQNSDQLKRTRSNLANITKSQNQVFYDPFMDPDVKAEQLRKLNRRRNDIARKGAALPSPK